MSAQSYEPAQTTESVSTAAGGGEPTSAAHRWAGSRRAWSIGLLASVGLVAVIAAVWIVLNGGSSAVPAEISVAKIINRVETDRPRETGPARERFVPAEIGQALLPGDGVRTYVNSEVRIDIQIQEYTRVPRGDVRDSLAGVDRARERLGYEPTVHLEEGLRRTWKWFVGRATEG